MVSHKKVGGIELSLGAGGIRFKKRPSGFNMCIGKAMKGTPGPAKGRYDKDFQKKFIQTAKSCGAKISPSKSREWGV